MNVIVDEQTKPNYIESLIKAQESEIKQASKTIKYYQDKLNEENYSFYLYEKYKLREAKYARRMLKKYVNLMEYMRIQTMSDLELEEHRDLKLNELNCKIQKLLLEEKQADDELFRLKLKEAESESKEIESKINRYTDINYGILALIRKQLEDITRQKLRIEFSKSCELRDYLLSQIKDKDDLAMILEASLEYLPSNEDKMLGVASNNPEKLDQMLTLLQQYASLCEPKYPLIIKGSLPKILINKIKSSPYYDEDKNEVINPYEIKTAIIDEFVEEFQKAKDEFESEFTLSKLSKLAGKSKERLSYSEIRENQSKNKYLFDIEDITSHIDFFEKHSDKISNNDLEQLKSVYKKRASLNKWCIFKREEILDLNVELEYILSKLYTTIINWYLNSSIYDILSITNIPFDDLDKIEKYIQQVKESIIFKEEEMLSLEKEIIKFMEDVFVLYSKKLVLEEKIRKIGGMSSGLVDGSLPTTPEDIENMIAMNSMGDMEKEKYEILRKRQHQREIERLRKIKPEEIKIPIYTTEEEMLEIIAMASVRVMEYRVIELIKFYAQYESDKKEAKIRGITVEDLSNHYTRERI